LPILRCVAAPLRLLPTCGWTTRSFSSASSDQIVKA
jgi:hypothetical protein